ncbi:MAG: HAD family phosphatase [Chloroflexi bacterium]|nr:HAD family phosphatase [Chloroflexota bacterium]
MLYQAILFDMDGVLIDTHSAVTVFWEKLATQWGVTLSPDDFARHIYGCTAAHTLDNLFPQISGAARTRLMAEMNDYEAHQTYTPVAGVIPFLRLLAEAGVPRALVTSGDRHKVAAVATQLQLNGLFRVTVTAEDVQRSKPFPDPYLRAAERLNAAPEHCLVLEDSLAGIRAAVAAGAHCIGVGVGVAALRAVGAAYVIPYFTAVTLSKHDDSLHLALDAGYGVKLAYA